jgi:hypothetical protein
VAENLPHKVNCTSPAASAGTGREKIVKSLNLVHQAVVSHLPHNPKVPVQSRVLTLGEVKFQKCLIKLFCQSMVAEW